MGGAVMLRPEDCIPGTLVECIDAAPREWNMPVPFIRERGVYTVVGLRAGRLPCGSLGVGVELRGHDENCFNPDRFRLLPDERLAVFRQMLAPAPKQKERV